MEFVSISTLLPIRLALSDDCSVDVLFKRLCASSNTVICPNSTFIALLVILYSCNLSTSIPIISDFVSDEPTLLKSTITFSSNNASFDISSHVKIMPLIPLVNDSSLVSSEPLYAPLLSLSNSLLSIISLIFLATSANSLFALVSTELTACPFLRTVALA